MVDIQDSDRSIVARPRGRYRRALMISTIVHVGLLLMLIFYYYPEQKSAAKSSVAGQAKPESTRLPNESRSTALAMDPEAAKIRASIESQIDASSNKSNEQKLDELDDQLERLERSAETKDIEPIAKMIADVMGLDRNQYESRPTPVEGVFDANSAQLRDVQRTQDENGKWSYQAVMIDSAGRNETVPLTESEGRSAYETFEKLKQYPMADSLYRQLVMPMIQQMLEQK